MRKLDESSAKPMGIKNFPLTSAKPDANPGRGLRFNQESRFYLSVHCRYIGFHPFSPVKQVKIQK